MNPAFKKISWLLWLLAALGLTLSVAGLVRQPEQAWPNFLLALFLALGAGLGGALFLAMHDASGGAWATRLRRVPEAMALTLPWLALLVLPLSLGLRFIYPWARPGGLPTETAAHLNKAWLNPVFFSARAVIYAGLWSLAALALVQKGRIPGASRKSRAAWGITFLIVFSLTCPLAGTDWLASLQPDWNSTIFGVYIFSGIFESGLALVLLLCLATRKLGLWPQGLLEEQLHDLGKLLFTFGCFWMYMWFSQYLLIWYADLPEETSYYLGRQEHGGFALMLATVALNFGVPFFGLMVQAAKKTAWITVAISLAVLLGHWLDWYWIMLPAFPGQGPRVGIWNLVFPATATALFLALFLRHYLAAPPVPLEEALKAEREAYGPAFFRE